MSLRENLNGDGFFMVRRLASAEAVETLSGAVDRALAGESAIKRAGAGYALRNLSTMVPEVSEFACSPGVTQVLAQLFLTPAFLVRSILFDKTAVANWRVGWHQDTTIAVKQRVDTPGFSGWSVKDGVVHVQPPVSVLEGMITLRLHLDAADEDNGPLEVLGGSHTNGLLDDDQMQLRIKNHAVSVCTAEPGDALIMRPLLLHSSPPARRPGHRRVIHLEFAADPLPGQLEWITPLPANEHQPATR